MNICLMVLQFVMEPASEVGRYDCIVWKGMDIERETASARK